MKDSLCVMCFVVLSWSCLSCKERSPQTRESNSQKEEGVVNTASHARPVSNEIQGPATKDDARDIDSLTGATIGLTRPQQDISEGFDSAPFLQWQRRTIAAEQNRPVHLVWNADSREAAYELMTALSPKISRDVPVLIKPNLAGFSGFANGPDNGVIGRTTDIRFIEGIVQYLIERGISRITIGESSDFDNPSDVLKMCVVSGCKDLVERYPQVRFVDMNNYNGAGINDTETQPVVIAMPDAELVKNELVLPQIYVDHLLKGLVIDVPKLKTHRFAVITGGMKNLMGVIGLLGGTGFPHNHKWMMHRELITYARQRDRVYNDEAKKEYVSTLEAFSHRLVDVYGATHPHMTLIDGVLATQGDGLRKTSSVPASVAIGSYNTVYADVIAAKIMGFWENQELGKAISYDSPPYLLEALNRFYGGKDLHGIDVRGATHLLDRDLEFELIGMGPFLLKGDANRKLSGEGVVHARYLGHEIADMDTLLSTWTLAHNVWITTDWMGNDTPPGVSTAVMCGYTDNELVFCFNSRYRELTLREGEPQENEVGDLFRWDVVEMFVDPDPTTKLSYYEFEYSPTGEYLDLAIEDLSNNRFDPSYESGMKGVQELDRDNQLWMAAIVIPFSSHSLPKPNPGDEWSLNLYRVEGKSDQRLYMAWNPTNTERPNFHVPQKFGKLIFDK